MGKLEIRPPTAADIIFILLNIREDDYREVVATSNDSIINVVERGIHMSDECWIVAIDSDVIAIWGVVGGRNNSILGYKIGCAWMLTTRHIESHKKEFLKGCKEALPQLMKRWDVLTNAIDCRHEKAIRWAQRLGFKLEEPKPFGVMGLPFRKFTVRRGDLNV